MQNEGEKIARIYMPLLNEGIPVVRPVNAEMLKDDIYRVLPLEHTTTENWEFPPYSLVRCKNEIWDGDEILVAREIILEK